MKSRKALSWADVQKAESHFKDLAVSLQKAMSSIGELGSLDLKKLKQQADPITRWISWL